jgi:hypothetical protein
MFPLLLHREKTIRNKRKERPFDEFSLFDKEVLWVVVVDEGM